MFHAEHSALGRGMDPAVAVGVTFRGLTATASLKDRHLARGDLAAGVFGRMIGAVHAFTLRERSLLPGRTPSCGSVWALEGELSRIGKGGQGECGHLIGQGVSAVSRIDDGQMVQFQVGQGCLD